MTTPPRTSTNKTALRASLKKEDDSLADRLAATDAPLGTTAPIEAPAVVETASAPAASASTPPRKAAASGATRSAAKAPATAAKVPAGTPGPAAAVEPVAAPAAVKSRPGRTKAAGAVEVGPVEQLEKVVKQKRDKLVRYSVDLLKSEEAAIDALREELSRAAGWAASKSDILRAGVRAFAEQKLEQMQKLLGSLPVATKGKGGKKDRRRKKGKK